MTPRILLFISLLVFISIIHPSTVQAQAVPVFVSGTDGHKSYRIPAIISLPNGDLFAFAEGRVHGSGDFGDINIVMKRSDDNGNTWSSMQTLVNYDSLQAGNPAPVVDLLDPVYPSGVVYLFYNTGNNHEWEVREGKGIREVWYIKSVDLGKTWSVPVNITAQVHRPNQPHVNTAYVFQEDWRSYALTPGHAMQFQTGKFKGRIFVAANHSSGPPQDKFRDYNAHGFYTDDHGKTFKLSESIHIPGSNEAIATELTGNRLIMSVRNQRGDIKNRIIAYSSDGGHSWDTSYFDKELPDPVCQGSIITLGYKNNKAVIASCNAANATRRDDLTLRISYDEGVHWVKSILIDKADDERKQDWTAYSDLVMINKRTVGILYERDNYATIVFTQVKWR
ncbi:MAG: exo-alpha-sialidase [bacterium]